MIDSGILNKVYNRLPGFGRGVFVVSWVLLAILLGVLHVAWCCVLWAWEKIGGHNIWGPDDQ